MSYHTTILAETSLASYWELDDTSGTTAVDQKARASGTIVNAPSLAQTSVLPSGEGTSILFAAASSQVINIATPIYTTTGYSVEFWVKVAAGFSTLNAAVYSEGANSAGQLLEIGSDTTTASKIRVNIRNNSAVNLVSFTSTTSVFDGNPHHVVWTDNNGSWVLYIDGNQESSGTYTPGSTTLTWAAIGALRRNTTSNYFSGNIDEVAVYTSALSSSAVTAHHSAGLASPPSNTVAPAVTGTASPTQILTTDNGTWTNTPTGYTYQWQISPDGSTGWANIPSATASTYSVGGGDATQFIRCQVTASNGSGSSSPANSNAVGAVTTASYNNGYLTMAGSANQYLHTPDSAALSITGDIDVRVLFLPDQWVPSVDETIIGSWNDDTPDRAWKLKIVGATGNFEFAWTADGTNQVGAISRDPSAVVQAGVPLWWRGTLQVNNGASGYTMTHYTSSDGSTWNQLGAQAINTPTTSIHDPTHDMAVGARTNAPSGGAFFVGKFYYAEIRSGIAGTVVASPDFRNPQSTSPSSYTDAQGNVWTVGGSMAATQQTLVSSSTAAAFSNHAKLLYLLSGGR